MKSDILRKIIGGILLVSLISLVCNQSFQEYLHIPKSITLFEGQSMEINNSEAISVTANVADEDSVVALSQEKGNFPCKEKLVGKMR